MDDYSSPRNYGNIGQRRGSEGLYYENYGAAPAGTFDKRNNLPRTISAANVQMAEQYKNIVQRDYVSEAPVGGSTFFANTPMFTLTLPVIEDKAFRLYVLDVLRDASVQSVLEKGRVINWCEALTMLTPLNTIRDGNCLLHAASLGMWGFQDRKHFLRYALNSTLEGKTRNTLYERWKCAREKENRDCGFVSEPHVMEKEWLNVKKQSATNFVTGRNLDSLDDFHVFVLANVLRRPIIMYAEAKIRSLAGGGTMQRLNFSGIYLPLLWDPLSCKRSPLPLTYCGGHFSALTMMESPEQYNRGQLVLPLMEYDGIALPVKFILRMEDPKELLYEYLDLITVQNSSPFDVRCCKIAVPEATKSNNYTYALARAFVNACEENFERERKGPSQDSFRRENRYECKNNCGRDGEGRFSGLCFLCYQQQQREFDSRRSHDSGRDQRFATQQFPPVRNDDRPPAQVMRSRTVVQSGGRGTVKCSECSEPGLPQFLGRCEKCHNRIQSNEANSIYEPLPPPPDQVVNSGSKPPSLPLPRDQSERSKCRTPGCDFFGTKEFRFYCSKCFDSNMEKILKEADEGPPISSGSAPNSAFSQDSKGLDKKESFSDPPKCRECRDFFASEELNGLCNKCFLKSTENPQGQLSSKPSSGKGNFSDTQGWNTRDQTKPDDKRILSRDHSSDSSQMYSKPVPKQSKGDQDSGLIYKITSQMGSVNLQAECVICRGEEDIDRQDSDAFVLCRKHTMQLIGRSGTGLRRGHEGSRPASFHPGDDAWSHRDPYSRTQPVRGQVDSGYGSEHSKRSSVDDDPYRFSQSGGGGAYSAPDFSPKSSYSSRIRQNNERHGFDSERDFYSRNPDYPPGDRGRVRGGGYEDAAGESGRGRSTFDDRQGYPRPGGNRWRDDTPPMDRRMSNNSRVAEDWNNGVDRRNGGSRIAGSVGGTMGGAGQGARSGPRAGAVGGKVRETSLDKLCRFPGCSYYCYEDLDRYCPDCYEEVHKKPVDRDRYPPV